MGINWIEHQGKRILSVDYSGLSEDKCLAQLQDYERAILKEGKGVLLLVDVTNASTGPAFMKEAKRMAPGLDPRIARQAILGIEGVKGLLLKAYNAITKNGGLKPYKSKDEALGFLAG